MEIKNIVGIDISKLTLDARIKTDNTYSIFENNRNGFKEFLKWLKKNLGQDLSTLMVVMEYTGLYSYQFEQFLHLKKLSFTKVPGLELKRSSGLSRGKSDRIDTGKIVEYGEAKKKKLKACVPQDKQLFDLKNLISLRDKLVRDKAGYIARLKELQFCLQMSATDTLFKIQQDIIGQFEKQIEKLEIEMQALVRNDEAIAKNYRLLTSIKGVGPVLSTYMIAYTNNFTSFENARKFACYVGIAPFPYTSGTSIKAKTKVSSLANKKIKTILYLCASSAVRYNQELKAYYECRLEKGKPKMSTLNVVQNKIVSRMFAIIKRQENYVSSLPAKI